MIKIITIIGYRLQSQSPELFRKISKWAVIIGAIAGIFLWLPIALPTWALSILTLVVGICTGLTSSSHLTTSSNEIIKETEKYFSHEAESGRQTTSH
ncbi:MAG: hypothetical protein DRP93_01445 [Candidatus Neomarinimicrobiota bacterium]|nr:MAG: hypothetical protein DRP93_01445 [Candidatus Neomarinimicrobiota bacterium]